MLYNFMELPDETIISHTETMEKDGKEQVKIYIEKPINGGFATATCWLPNYDWQGVSGFTDKEMAHLKDYSRKHGAYYISICQNGRI